MEIKTPLTMWNNYDKSGNTNETIVSHADCGDYDEYHVYFNGDIVSDGITRIYAKFYTPKTETPVPAVLFFDDSKNTLGFEHIKVLLDEGFAVLYVDYLGKREGVCRYTLYPDSIIGSKQKGLCENLRESKFYVYGCIGLKALNYLQSKEIVQSNNIGVLGVGNASSIVWTLAVKEKLKAGMTFYGGGFVWDENRTDPRYLLYKAAFDIRSYALHAQFPVLIQAASNEKNNALDYLTELYDCSDKHYFSIAPRARRAVATAQKKNLKYWFSQMLINNQVLPTAPEINARQSDGKLYYDLDINEEQEVSFVKLFTSQGDEEAAFRNWSEQKVEKVVPGKYISRVDVYTENEPIRAFAVVKYLHSLYLTSSVLLKMPMQMKVIAEKQTSRLIYDNDMGLDDFLVPNDYDVKYNEEKLVMRKGPYDIEGVCSMTGQLTTFKIGDYKYKGNSDASLKILLSVENTCNVTFTVMDKERTVYSCVKECAKEDGWCSVSLAPFDFKSQKSVLSNWNNVVSITITNEETKLILSSMLWV